MRKEFILNGPVYWLDLLLGRLEVSFWEKDPLFWWHLSWGNDIFAFHLTAGPLVITVDAK